MSAMHLLLLALRWTALAAAVLAALLALLLWRRPHEVWATRWQEHDDGWGMFV